MSEDRGRLFGYEIQHIFVQEIASNPDAVAANVLLPLIGSIFRPQQSNATDDRNIAYISYADRTRFAFCYGA